MAAKDTRCEAANKNAKENVETGDKDEEAEKGVAAGGVAPTPASLSAFAQAKAFLVADGKQASVGPTTEEGVQAKASEGASNAQNGAPSGQRAKREGLEVTTGV